MRYSHYDRVVTAELTRPANVTAYSANQVIGMANPFTILTFPSVFRGAIGTSTTSNATGYLRSIRLLTNQSSCTAAITIWLYNSKPQIIPDGQTFQNNWVERVMCLGHFAMSALAQFGNSDYALSEQWFTQFNILRASGVTGDLGQLYVQLVAGGTFTPASGQVFRVELGVNQNEEV